MDEYLISHVNRKLSNLYADVRGYEEKIRLLDIEIDYYTDLLKRDRERKEKEIAQ